MEPLDERGFQPQVQFTPTPGAFEGECDDLLTAALERLRKVALPEKPIEGSAAVREEQSEPARPPQSAKGLTEYSAAIKDEAQDASRPKVISVSPANDATGVSAVTELRVQFDRPMDPMSLKLDWESGGFWITRIPPIRFGPTRVHDSVHLEPGALHQIVLNKPLLWSAGRPE
jgi:hypothetical protein